MTRIRVAGHPPRIPDRLTPTALRDLADQVRENIGQRHGMARQCCWAGCPSKALEHSGVWVNICGVEFEVATCREHVVACAASTDYSLGGRP